MKIKQFLSPNHRIGREGKVPDIIVCHMSFMPADEAHERYMSADGGKAPHFLILRDGSVRQYVNIGDAAAFNPTSNLKNEMNYHKKARSGFVVSRSYSADLYTISVAFEGVSGITEAQALSARELFIMLFRRIFAVYGFFFRLDGYHIIGHSDVDVTVECPGENFPFEKVIPDGKSVEKIAAKLLQRKLGYNEEKTAM